VWAVGQRTLLAGLDFNFSKIFCDWVFVAKVMMKTWSGSLRTAKGEGEMLVGMFTGDVHWECRLGDYFGDRVLYAV